MSACSHKKRYGERLEAEGKRNGVFGEKGMDGDRSRKCKREGSATSAGIRVRKLLREGFVSKSAGWTQSTNPHSQTEKRNWGKFPGHITEKRGGAMANRRWEKPTEKYGGEHRSTRP